MSLNIDDTYTGGGDYLKAADLQKRRINLTIETAKLETMKDNEKKICLGFEGTEKRLTLNKTNARMIADLLNERDAERWIGTTIALRPDKTQNPEGVVVDCIRVDLELPPQVHPNSLGGRVLAAHPAFGQTAAAPPARTQSVPIQPEPEAIPFALVFALVGLSFYLAMFGQTLA